MKRLIKGTKKGAASFYIVAFSTLILVIIAASFATAVIHEVTRTSNNDLSQSAHDSALAGIEDAKLAFLNYERCKKGGAGSTVPNGAAPITCNEIIYLMEHPDCYMVGRILGRLGEKDTGEVLVSDVIESSGNKQNNLNQAYTCVEIQTKLNDYRATLTSSNNQKVVKIDLADGVDASQISYAKIKWYSQSEQIGGYFNFANITGSSWRYAFEPIKNTVAATPPVISVDLIQTNATFVSDDFVKIVLKGSGKSKTNRASMTFVPTGDTSKATYNSGNNSNTRGIGIYNTTKSENFISSRQIASTNTAASNKGGSDYPYMVYCQTGKEFACEVTLDLPAPYDNNPSDTTIKRNNDTFMFVVTLPYGQPDADFAIEVYCNEGVSCSKTTVNNSGVAEETNSNLALLDGVQVNIDSTGRANDLYRRVETRLESADASFQYPLYGIQLLKNDSKEVLLNKNFPVTKEYSSSTYPGYDASAGSYLIQQ